jgi:hypothetical protein
VALQANLGSRVHVDDTDLERGEIVAGFNHRERFAAQLAYFVLYTDIQNLAIAGSRGSSQPIGGWRSRILATDAP